MALLVGYGVIVWWSTTQPVQVTYSEDTRVAPEARLLFPSWCQVALWQARRRLTETEQVIQRRRILAERVTSQERKYAGLWASVETQSPYRLGAHA